MHHERTVPKTPEQNGVAERLNRTLVEMTRSMLLDSKLPHNFWAEALATAAYIRNRCPTKAVDSMTPYKAWTSLKPTVNHFHVFGCGAFMHIPKDERHKIDSKSKTAEAEQGGNPPPLVFARMRMHARCDISEP